LSRATIKGCISTVALSLSLSLARAKAAAARVFWSVDAETTTPTVAEAFLFPNEGERERYPDENDIDYIHTNSIDRFRIGPRNALLWKPKRPARAPPRKKKLEAIGTILTFFGTWTLFVIGAVVKVVEVIIIILSSKRVRVLLSGARKEDKKIQKKYTIIFPLDFFPPKVQRFSLSLSLSLSLSQNKKKPHLGFSFFTYDTLN